MIRPSALNSVSASPFTRVRNRIKRDNSPRLKTASFNAIIDLCLSLEFRSVTSSNARLLNVIFPLAMHSTASRNAGELTHVKKPSDPTLIPKIGGLASPSCPVTFKIVPSPPTTTSKSALPPSCAIVASERWPLTAAVSFSSRTDIEKRANSAASDFTSSPTPGLPVCAINPIVFGCI